MTTKTALITGVTGQDGAYLSELLLDQGYLVHGMKRRASLFNTARIDHLYQDPHEKEQRFFLHYGDLTDAPNIIRIIQEVQPDEIYNLGAQSQVKVSFDSPVYTGNVDALGALRILEAIRILKLEDRTRFYQASTSELYGQAQESPQTERTPFYPRSPYACAKLYAYWATVNYREAYGMFACNGILFNHESPWRGETFVTRKITRAAAHIALGLESMLYLGNLDAVRDWGHAQDYVRAQWLMLQQDYPEDYVIASGEQHSVREFCQKAFSEVGLELEWRGRGVHEQGVVCARRQSSILEEYAGQCQSSPPDLGQVVVSVDARYFRPTEVDILMGDATKARNKLGWSPRHSFDDLIKEMVRHDTIEAARASICEQQGVPFNASSEIHLG